MKDKDSWKQAARMPESSIQLDPNYWQLDRPPRDYVWPILCSGLSDPPSSHLLGSSLLYVAPTLCLEKAAEDAKLFLFVSFVFTLVEIK